VLLQSIGKINSVARKIRTVERLHRSMMVSVKQRGVDLLNFEHFNLSMYQNTYH
jgi:hypothetical protein